MSDALTAAGADRPATCAEFGDAITKATTGDEPGRHTVAQVQAMQTVLYALAPAKGHRVRLDPELRRPPASALADFGADVYARLHSRAAPDVRADRVRAQPVEMIRIWGTTRALDE
ncbi:hypothetical protein ACIQV2_23805 [Streptomyces globosus]|uniref:hypothetical protein n=1 Tax=Streptomyces globosus TaxID=68209 RepID=UPI003817D0B1